MATTNFNNLTTEEKKVWSRDIWKVARNHSFVMSMAGSGSNSMIQKITELTRTERGDQAVITLVPDLEGDGVAGDNQLEGNEEEIKAYDQVVRVDQLRNANRHKGRMEAQKTVVNFRETSRDVLGYWCADRIDQMAFLTMTGVAYTFTNRGAARGAGSQLSTLSFAADVTAPTTNRHRRWDATNGLVAGATASVAAVDTPTYAMMVDAKAYMKTNYIRGIKGPGNEELYHVFMTPQGLAKLKLDSDFLANVRNAGVRGKSNPLFSGAIVTVDGLIIHEFRHVYNTLGATSGVDKWGAGSNVDGQAILFCGAQALAMADLGQPYWTEKGHDYDNQQAVAVGKIFGFKKPVFNSHISGADEDFGVLRVDTAI
jgi:N4-gp56 family major capsid protein